MDLCASILVFLIPIWFMFIVILSVITISSLNDQYGCGSFCTSALIHGPLCNVHSDSQYRCSSSVLADLISSALVHCGMSMCDSIAFMFMLIPCISLSLFVSWLCLDNQSLMNNWDLDLYSILLLSWWIHSNIPCGLFNKLSTSLPNIATSGLWSVITLTLQVKK